MGSILTQVTCINTITIHLNKLILKSKKPIYPNLHTHIHMPNTCHQRINCNYCNQMVVY